MRGIILAGGKGTRLKPYTTILPKPLMPVGDYPIIEIILRQLRHHGFKEITIAVGHLSELIKAFLGNGEKLGLKINYSYEEIPLGTIGPLSLIKGLDETFLVMNGDTLTSLNYSSLVRFHKEKKAILTIASCKRAVNVDYGVIKHDKENVITNYIEKPTIHYNVSMGIYVLEPIVLKFLTPNKKVDLPDIVKKLIKEKMKVAVYLTDAFWLDIGRHEDYEIAGEKFEKLKNKLLFGV
jgi:NDP-sugar pyrophosphorylase family protein